MKKLMLITALSLTVPFAYAEQPYGEPQPATSAPGASMPPAASMPEASMPPAASMPEAGSVGFTQIDINQDGMIDKQEASSFSALEVQFEAIDANQDGALDAAEFSQTQR